MQHYGQAKELATLVTMREGKILRYRESYDEAAALEAAGVSDQDAHADS